MILTRYPELPEESIRDGRLPCRLISGALSSSSAVPWDRVLNVCCLLVLVPCWSPCFVEKALVVASFMMQCVGRGGILSCRLALFSRLHWSRDFSSECFSQSSNAEKYICVMHSYVESV